MDRKIVRIFQLVRSTSSSHSLFINNFVSKTTLNEGPGHFHKWFYSESRRTPYDSRAATQAHSRQLHNYLDGTHTELLRRSALGLTSVYNKLPPSMVKLRSVKNFQHELQQLVINALQEGRDDWANILHVRKPDG